MKLFSVIRSLKARDSIASLSILLGVLYFFVGTFTLPSYGINWDTINHLPRGQAYLNYFLTGNKDFSNLPLFQMYWQNPDSLGIDASLPKELIMQRSFYQSDATEFNWFMLNDGSGHPPLSDILSSVFNIIFFQKLGLVNDIDSYHLYGIFLSSLLISLLFYWIARFYGVIPGIISALSLALYPLFWSESHFNTEKDIPEAVFISLVIFSFWKGAVEQNWKWFIVSGIGTGLALGTKFNILFVPLIIIIWLVFLFLRKKEINLSNKLLKNPHLIFSIFLIPVIASVIFIVSWPYLWADPVSRIMGVFNFYTDIGLTENPDQRFIGPLGINYYPLLWILYTSPISVLVLGAVGALYVLRKGYKEKNGLAVLILLWFLLPILRVSWSGATVYGGIRQIMEFVPALALLSGLGAYWILSAKKNNLILKIILLISFIPLILKLISIHPFENAYFNSLIGGLEGAKEQNIPSWGNTFGSAYRRGFSWINRNSPENSTVAFAFELSPNFPRIFLRPDLNLDNRSRSGEKRLGEYVITLTYQGTKERSYYDKYLETFLNPVYEGKVDGVSVVKVWKNDIEHTKQEFLEIKEVVANVQEVEEGVLIDLKNIHSLARVEAKFNTIGCNKDLKSAYAQISQDGLTWSRLPGTMPGEDWNAASSYGDNPQENSFIQPFAADKARYIRYVVSPKGACLAKIKELKVFVFPKL